MGLEARSDAGAAQTASRSLWPCFLIISGGGEDASLIREEDENTQRRSWDMPSTMGSGGADGDEDEGLQDAAEELTITDDNDGDTGDDCGENDDGDTDEKA